MITQATAAVKVTAMALVIVIRRWKNSSIARRIASNLSRSTPDLNGATNTRR
jgi:hypothetical protein